MSVYNKIISGVLTLLLVLCFFGCASNPQQQKNTINQSFLSSNCYKEVIDTLNSACGDVTPYKTDFDTENGILAINVTAMDGLGALVKDNNESIKAQWLNMCDSLSGLGEAIEDHIQASDFEIDVSISILSDDDSTILFKSFNGKTYNIFEPEIQNVPSINTKPSDNSSNSSNLPDGVYWCMGKNDTCQNKTYDAFDLYCSKCDPNNDNKEG